MTKKLRNKTGVLDIRKEIQASLTIEKKWGKMRDAVAVSGLNRDFIFDLIREGKIESFLYKRRRNSKGGSRMINLLSLIAHLDKLSAESRPGQMRGEQ
jgi:hypothetical protein